MSNWWGSWTKNELIGLAVFVVTVFFGIATLLNNQGNTITQSPNNGDAIVHEGTGDINTGGTHIQNQTNINGITLEQYEQGLKRREAEVRAELEDEHAEDRQVLELELSDIQQQLQNITASYEEHIASLNERIAQLEQLRGELPDALLDQAIEALQQGDSEKADRLFQKIGEEAEGHIERAAVAAFQRGKIAEDDFRYKDALQFYENNVRLRPDNKDGWNSLGNLYSRTSKMAKAENAYNTLLKLSGTNQKYEANAYNNLGILYQTRGDLDKAIEFYEKSLVINLELGSKQGKIRNYGNLGEVYRIRGDLDKAVKFYEKSLTINLELGRKEGIANNYANLGIVYQTRGDLDKAVEFYEKSLVINLELGREEKMAINYGNLGNVYQTRGDLDKAVEFYKKSLAIGEELGSKHGMAIDYTNLGVVYETRGDMDKAVEFYERSLTLFKEIGAKREIAHVKSLLDEVHQIQTTPETVD